MASAINAIILITCKITLNCLFSVGYHLKLRVAITFTAIILSYQINISCSLMCMLTIYVVRVKIICSLKCHSNP